MPKRSTTLALTLPPRPPAAPATQWLYGAIRAEILEGRLRPGARLPASRDLARQYGLSRGTIVSAFAQLSSEGYVDGTIGSGTRVSEVLPDDLLLTGPSEPVQKARPRRVLSSYGRRVGLFPAYRTRPIRAFRADQPALDLFPTTLWAQLAARRLRRATTSLLLGTSPMGYGPLREAVADYVRTARGVQCTADQIAIVSGVQEALDLVTRLFVDPLDRVCMEDPGYPGAALAFEARGARVLGLSVDDEGMTIPRGRARLAYVTPGHQFPLGISMSLRRRLALLEWANLSGAMILEDDYDSEYRYSGRPVPALQGLDRRGIVLFAGSFSKVLFPSLRLGYLVVPSDLIDVVTATLSITSRHAPLIDQAILADFLVEGHFARHVRRMREIYAERLAVLMESAQAHLAGLLSISGLEAGLQTAAWVADGIDAQAAARAAAVRDVEVTPLAWYTRGRRPRVIRQGLHLGFAAVDVPEIRRGVRDLALALESLS
ncbi:MAG TPA: PLP-dependent aminotransferase family protein [Gemmatimonadaceae bacterium]|jgi:GntR family transcriptional regulator/MocR family aminotransferase|nr:PLP-dependent aminotransferase family protein [Gemmatimonadaceae bacterium]